MFHCDEDSKTEIKSTNVKGKGKVGVAIADNTSQQIQQLQGAVKGLTKLLQGNQQNSQTTQIPQASQGQSSANFVNNQGSKGGRGGYRDRGGRDRGRGRGGLILCYWCRDFLPKEQANHKVAQCPYQKQAKDNWWKSQLGNVLVLNLKIRKTSKGNY